MSLGFSVTLIAGAVIGMSTLPQKLAPKPTDTSALATVNGILGYCARIDPEMSAHYAQRKKMFGNGYSDNDDDHDADDKKYGTDVKAIDSRLSKVPFAAGLSACKAFLAGR